MILVPGKSLVDLIVRADGSIYPSPGGGPFNAARTMSRLGQPTRFLGRFSADPLGVRLADRLRQDKVEVTSAVPVPEPTALAIVALSGCGASEYWFHLASTAGFQLDRLAAQQALAAGDLGSAHRNARAGRGADGGADRATCDRAAIIRAAAARPQLPAGCHA